LVYRLESKSKITTETAIIVVARAIVTAPRTAFGPIVVFVIIVVALAIMRRTTGTAGRTKMAP
jgi:hypothetical protein